MYELDKSPKKYFCPNCGKKRFVRFVDARTKILLDPKFGRCDRQESCGYLHHPSKEAKMNVIKEKVILPQLRFVDFEEVVKSMQSYDLSSFGQFLSREIGPMNTEALFKAYKIGTLNNSTVFWFIDRLKRVRTASLIRYK